MYLPIREAQHLCWKTFKKINEKLSPREVRVGIPVMVTHLLEEACEVAAVAESLEGFKPPGKPKTKEMLATELSDLRCIIFFLAERYDINWKNRFSKQ